MRLHLLIVLIPHFVFAQNKQEKCACSEKNKSKLQDYFEQIAAQSEFISECSQKYLESLPDNVKSLPKTISHLASFAINLIKSLFPRFAREHKISGAVDVEIIFDEHGFVIYAKAISGKKIFYKSAAQVYACSILPQACQTTKNYPV